MATEATLEKSADAPSPTHSETVLDSEAAAQHVDPKVSVLNGGRTADELENKRITSIEEQNHSTDVSVSGGSDTEAFKTDASTSQPDDKGHARTSSTVKKPATFKAVSVNKTFLASKGGPGAAVSKPGDKSPAVSGIPGSQLPQSAVLSSRPRLIAKTGGGGRDSAPGFAANGGKAAAAPDPNTVWNKNRPIPTPEPKKLSDEELKKYGIHMATRLQSEDKQGQSNWADIDDDDEDWAPEAITWTDGTKSTLPQVDEPQIQAPDPTPVAPVEAVKEQLASKETRSPVPSRTASPSVKSTNLASGKGLILKAGSADKVSLVAKPPAPPGPAKSPWASLPPVQRAPPVVAELPVQHPGSKPLARDHGAVKPVAISGAREIAADDFSRSTWREGPATSQRELYNSQSGRYEPVGDRRPSFRAEASGRPSLLQRPHHAQHDPAEPSPTFQSSRPVQDGPYGRRRGSSNVSGGSGYLQRVGKAYEPGSMPPPDVLNARRGSFAASTDSHSPSSQQGGRLQSGHQWHPRTSPAAAHASPHYSHATPELGQAAQPTAVPAAGIPSEEEAVEYQKRLMKEKREEAIKRRLEEEAREEAAKAERIRLKLEAMGPAPDRKSAKKDVSSSQDVPSPSTTSIQPAATAVTPTTGHADTQPAPQQSEQTSQSADTSLAGAIPPGQNKADPEIDAAAQLGPPGALNPSQPALWDGSAQAPGRFTSWPSSTQLSRNVWGSPNNDRGLGNGTFNPDLGRVPETRTTPVAQAQAKGPAPIAPPSSSRVLSRNQQPGQAYPASKGDRYASAEPRQYNDKQNQWVSAVLQSDTALRDQQVKERQELDQRRVDQGLSVEQAQPAIKHTWRAESAASRMEAGSRTGAPSWDQKLEDRSKQNIPAPAHDGLAANGVIGAGSSPLLASGSSTSSQPRLSRFFPSKDKDPRSEAHAHAEGERSESPSPPPPTMDDHPVYDGDASHPHVSLPRPQPVVKLPPARGATSGLVRGQRSEAGLSNASASGYKSNHISAASNLQSTQHAGVATQSAPPQSQQQWQEKIYELTGRRAAPKSPVVESASRSALDQPTQQEPATVSLPTHRIVRENGGVTSKPMAEECFEEQEMGSLPPVRIPHNVPAAAWQLAIPPVKSFPRGFAVLPTTVKHFDMSDFSKPFMIRISLPNMPQPKELPYHHSSSRANSRGSGHGRAGGRHRGSGASYRGGNGGKREAPSSYSNELSATQPSASSSAPRGRGSYRGRSGEPWPRRSAHPTTN